jgi:hypothetical protein
MIHILENTESAHDGRAAAESLGRRAEKSFYSLTLLMFGKKHLCIPPHDVLQYRPVEKCGYSFFPDLPCLSNIRSTAQTTLMAAQGHEKRGVFRRAA